MALGDRPLKHLGNQGSDRRALAPGKGHVGKERMAFEGFHDRDNAIVTPHPQVVTLGDVVGQHNS